MAFQIIAGPVSTTHNLDPALQGTNTTLGNSTACGLPDMAMHLHNMKKHCSRNRAVTIPDFHYMIIMAKNFDEKKNISAISQIYL